jgi:hypothetical protein
MKSKIAALLIAGQLVLAAQPALAAELIDDRAESARRGAFAGARIRVPLGETKEKAHAGLALTTTLHSTRTAQTRFAPGVELGVAGDETLRLSLAGKPVSQLVPGGQGPDGDKKGVSTLGWVGIGVGALVVVGLGGLLWLNERLDCDEDEECS